ncbi:MAG TPA: AIM24 family protein, partial [Anaerolineales bacterium]|nr:AIM24 family protein [Anaerolineales bacterium]
RVDTGCLVAFETGIDFDIKFIGGFTNALFGGEGLFLTTLTGPGRVYLQSLPFSRLADRIRAAGRMGRQVDETQGLAGLGGDLFKNITSGSGD